MKLEYVDTLVVAHPYVKGFDRTSHCVDDVEMRAVSIGDVPPAVALRSVTDIVDSTAGGTVWTTTFYIGLQIERKQGTLRCSNSRNDFDAWSGYSWIEWTEEIGYIVSYERVY